MKLIEFIAFITGLVIVGLALVFVLSHAIEGPPDGWKFLDLITILLTVALVVITALAIGIAGLGVWGYTQIQKAAVDKAVEVIPDAVANELKSDGIREMMREQFSAMWREEASRKVSEGDGNGGYPGASAEFPELSKARGGAGPRDNPTPPKRRTRRRGGAGA